MTSRLDRLFVLLEAGVGAGTRQAAARQLGEVQRTRPEELHRLLARLMNHLRSPVWETRLAAAQAVEAILANVPEWKPPPYDETLKEEKKEEGESNGRLRCEEFDIEGVLRRGSHLMASQGLEFDMGEDSRSNGDSKERLTKQRQMLNAKLGLDFASKLGVDLSDVYNTEDLCPSTPLKTTPKSECVRRPVQELVPVPSDKPLSSREMNVAKRRARQAALSKQKSRENDDDEVSETKRAKMEPAEDYLSLCTGAVPDASGAWSESRTWPLQGWCCVLQGMLFDGAWETRHGAASALRELLRARVCAGGGRKHHQDEDGHQEWLEDLALRFLCVLALDRFGDFVSDQVVAPVRETSAQALGVAAARLREERATLLAGLLARLAAQPHWEARHGALLGLQYLLQGRQEVAISSGALEQVMLGLEDSAEDVSGVAAAALVPAAGVLARARPAMLPDVVARLWALLHDQDDLAAPANSYMALLAALMALPEAAQVLHPIDLADVLPRMWPYLQHSSSSVRKAAMQTLNTITKPLCSPSSGSDCPQELSWTWQLLQNCMRHIYQRILFEHVQDIQDIAMEVWSNLVAHASLGAVLLAACPLLATWLCLAMQPGRLPADVSLLLCHYHRPSNKERRVRATMQMDCVPPEARPSQKWYIGGSESQTQALRERNVTRARCRAADALGHLSCYLVQPAPDVVYKPEDESPVDCYVKVLVAYLGSGSGVQRLVSGLVVAGWARRGRGGAPGGHPLLVRTLHHALHQYLYYDEVAINCNKVLQEARDLVAMMKHYKIPLKGEEYVNILRLEQVLYITNTTQPLIAILKNKRVATNLEERRQALHTAVTQCSREQDALHVSVQASLAGACAYLEQVPEKLNPVVRPLMDSIKRESAEELQLCSANALAKLLDTIEGPAAARRAQDKVLANLKTFLCCDPEVTPKVSLSITTEESNNAESGSNDSSSESCDLSTDIPVLDKYNGILTLWEQQRQAERAAPKRGRPPHPTHGGPHAPLDVAPDAGGAQKDKDDAEDEVRRHYRIQRRGATLALTSLTKYFGDKLPKKLPKLWEFITQPLEHVMTEAELDSQDVESAEELISRLQVLETVSGCLHESLWEQLLERTTALLTLTRHRLTSVRHMSSRVCASWSSRSAGPVVVSAVSLLLPALEEASGARARAGAAEGLARIVAALGLRVVPHAPILAVPLLGRMSDHNPAVRQMSTRCFASLIQLMPLEGAVPLPEGLPQELLDRREKDKRFLDQLFNPSSIANYKIPLPISAELRSYQQAGVNWLRFLNEYKLHGVLCDDMGLGKTLQSIVVVAGDHHDRATRYRAHATPNHAPLPSLVVCPPTLTGHWVFEVTKFIPSEYLKPLQYVGPPVERERLRTQVKNFNLIVASYDIVRKDIDFFSKITWNYCILDEGHVIKNGKTKAFKAIKRLVANHRLILSGTPIQNNVLELWSLFEFLLPGLLGTERQFAAQYARPILLAREPRASPHQLQAGARAVEALHRQVLPFLLRRVKEDVLKELPPKITQDYYCELSPLQRKLYEHCARAQPSSQRPHVFQALQYLQNVCNHPKLVLDREGAHPAHATFLRDLGLDRNALNDINHACKLPALKQLLSECGIGVSECGAVSGVSAVSAHRALVFCQRKGMLDVLEHDLLRAHLPAVTYRRLDGTVLPAARHHIVTAFNTDPGIDLLLLTTAVGGLGLNLTGADTVIFVEHDWNPMKDLQAMDRAHRIGQRKVVNVYRLITRGTLEEKIMGLQKFKLATANTVISSENASIETMGTDQLLNLFQNKESSTPGATTNHDTLPELWDERQYEDEYDMNKFINSLPKVD